MYGCAVFPGETRFLCYWQKEKGTSPRLMEVEGGQWSVNFCGPGNNIVILSRVQGFHPAALLPPKR